MKTLNTLTLQEVLLRLAERQKQRQARESVDLDKDSIPCQTLSSTL
jgi:hypothetical protein